METTGANQAPDFKNEFAEVNGVNLHYVVSGSGQLILFLHGFPEFWYQWKNQLSEFGNDYMAVAPDMRGYNLSDKPGEVEQYDLWHLVEDVAGLARHLQNETGFKKFILVGHDWGGVVAWAFAIAHPDQIEKLVIINAPHPGIFTKLLKEDPEQQKASQYMFILQGGGAEEVLSANNFAMLDKLLLARGRETGVFTERDREAYVAAWSQPGALTGALNYYRALRINRTFQDDDGGEVSGIFTFPMFKLNVYVPVLVIWGEKEMAFVGRNVDLLPECVSDLTVKRIPDGSHWVVHEKPELVNRYIRAFLSR